MARLPDGVTSDKVKSATTWAAIVGAVITIGANVLSDSPMADSWVTKALSNPATQTGLITLATFIAGRQTEEKAFDPQISGECQETIISGIPDPSIEKFNSPSVQAAPSSDPADPVEGVRDDSEW